MLAGYPVGLCQPGEPLAAFLRLDAERDERPGVSPCRGGRAPGANRLHDEGTVERRGADGQ